MPVRTQTGMEGYIKEVLDKEGKFVVKFFSSDVTAALEYTLGRETRVERRKSCGSRRRNG